MRPRAFLQSLRTEPLHFWLLCSYYFVEYVRPQVIYGFLDSVPLGRITLGLALITFLFRERSKRRLHVGDTALSLFLVVLYLSSLFAEYPGWAGLEATVIVNWVLVYVLTAQIVTSPRRLFVFVVLFLLWSLKLSQYGARTFALRGFTFTDWGVMGPEGWFQNSGELAVQMVVFLPMSLFFIRAIRTRIPRGAYLVLLGLLPGTAALTVIASSSRGAQLGLAAVILFLVLQTRYRVRGLVMAILAFGALWLVVPDQQRDRLSAMGDDGTSVSRLTYWEDGVGIANDHPVLGIGFNNWLPYYREHFDPYGELPHNIFVEAAAELGYAGLAAFLFLCVATFSLNRRTRRMSRLLPTWGGWLTGLARGLDAALVGFIVSGFFVTVLYYPFFWINLAITAALWETTRRQYNTVRVLNRQGEPSRPATNGRRAPTAGVPALQQARWTSA